MNTFCYPPESREGVYRVKDLDIYMSYLKQILAAGNLFNYRQTITPLRIVYSKQVGVGLGSKRARHSEDPEPLRR